MREGGREQGGVGGGSASTSQHHHANGNRDPDHGHTSSVPYSESSQSIRTTPLYSSAALLLHPLPLLHLSASVSLFLRLRMARSAIEVAHFRGTVF